MISYVFGKFSDITNFFDDLDQLTIDELNLLVSRFITYMSIELKSDGSEKVFRYINLNNNNFCFNFIDHLLNTVCSLKFYNDDITNDDLMSRILEEIDNYNRGCNLKILSSNLS